MPVKGVAIGAVVAIVASLVLLMVVGAMTATDSEPNSAASTLSWVLGTLARAAAGYVAGRLTIRTGRGALVIGAGALAGAAGYVVFFVFLYAISAAGGNIGISAGDLLGLVIWTAQSTLGGAIGILLHRGRLRSAASTSTYY